MKKCIAMLLTIVLIFTISFPSFSLEVKNDYKSAQKNYGDFVKSQLLKLNLELSNSNEYGTIVNKQVIIDNLDNFEAIKESFIKPVVIYEEVITLEKTDTLFYKNPSINTSSIEKTDTDTTTLRRSFIANFTATVVLEQKITADRTTYNLPEGGQVYAYKLKRYELNWATDNKFTGVDGAGVYKADVEINQVGVKVGSGNFINEDFIINFDERKSSDRFSKSYFNTAYSVVAPVGGLQAMSTIHLIFAAGPGATYDHTEDLQTGWGSL